MLHGQEEIDDWIQSVEFANRMLHKSHQDVAQIILEKVNPSMVGYAWVRMQAHFTFALT